MLPVIRKHVLLFLCVGFEYQGVQEAEQQRCGNACGVSGDAAGECAEETAP